MNASTSLGRVAGFAEGMAYARDNKTFKDHPLFGIDVKAERAARMEEHDKLTFTLQQKLPEFASSEDGLQLLKAYLGDDSDEESSEETQEGIQEQSSPEA